MLRSQLRLISVLVLLIALGQAVLLQRWAVGRTSASTLQQQPTEQPNTDNAATIIETVQAATGIVSNANWTPVEHSFDGVTMVLVPAGCFMMGDDGAGGEQCFDEPFWIDKYEVTRAHYQVCVDDGICEPLDANGYSSEPNQPINYVSLLQAEEYADWRGCQVPTEAEWEYAARGPDNLLYPWGNEWISENANGDTYDIVFDKVVLMDVGSYPAGASWVGAHDMSGNAYEWTRTVFRPYPYSPDSEHLERDRFDYVVLRGGAAGDNAEVNSTVFRNMNLANRTYIGYGIRLVCAHSSP